MRTTWLLVVIACRSDESGAPEPPETPEAPLTLIGLQLVPDDAPVNGMTLIGLASRAAVIEAACAATDDPTDLHYVGTSALSGSPTVGVYGLLADTEYRCDVVLRDGAGAQVSGSVTARTAGLPDDFPVIEVDWPAGDRARSDGGWTLFNHWIQDGDPKMQKLVLVDSDGRVRWYFVLDLEVSVGIEANLAAPGVIALGGGMGFPPTLVSVDGAILYRSPDPSSGGLFHHHTELLPSGDMLSLATADNEANGVVWEGFIIETRQAWTGALTWVWNSQAGVDAGVLPTTSQPDEDLFHANAIQAVDDVDGPGWYVSLRALDTIARVDAASGTIDWTLGPGGDFVLLDADGAPLPDDQWFYGQHDPEYALPSVLVHDNGYGRPGDDYSRAMELHVDVARREARLVWAWTEEGWSEPVWGDLDRLANGDVLLTQGHCWDCGTGDPARRSTVLELDPRDDAVIWRLVMPEERAGVYRAERIGGCALFGSVAECPELAGPAAAVVAAAGAP